MAQKYEVHIDGKVLIIGEPPKFKAMPNNWLALKVETSEEMQALVGTLIDNKLLQGAHAFGAQVDQLLHWFRQGYVLVEAAGGAVSDGAGRLLAIHRLGRWDLPKGKVETGEALKEAAVREVQEETGLAQLRVVRPLCETWHTYGRNGKQHLKCTHWYLMEGDAAEGLAPQTEEDIDAVRWLDAAGVEDLRKDTYPSVLRVLNAWEEARRGPA